MIVQVQEVNLTNVWKESFTDRQSGEQVEFWRAMMNKAGEPPMQVGVQKDKVEELQINVGCVGNAEIDIDARPGSRVRVYLVGFDA